MACALGVLFSIGWVARRNSDGGDCCGRKVEFVLRILLSWGLVKLPCDLSERRLRFLLWGSRSVGWDKTALKEGSKGGVDARAWT